MSINAIAPFVTKTIRCPPAPWINDIKRAIKIEIALMKLFKITDSTWLNIHNEREVPNHL